MGDILVAPTEPAALKAIGTTSSIPERFGCDVLWRARGAWWGVQRKELRDLLASVADGRLAKELGQMQMVRDGGGWTCLVIEGPPRWTTEGQMLGDSWGGVGGRFTHDAWWSLLMSVGATGCGVQVVKDTAELAAWCTHMKKWSEKNHGLAVARPKQVATNSWGEQGNEHWGSWFLQGIPGVGADRAMAIVKHFGRVPMKMDVERGELLKVKGLGEKTVDAIMKALGDG